MGLFLSFIGLHVAVLLYLVKTTVLSLEASAFFFANLKAAAISWSFLIGLVSSMLVYRAWFHRLRAFPGPFAARLSNWYFTSLIFKQLQQFKEVDELHAEYGDFVRVGPSELSITHPAAASIIHASDSPCSKGPWYVAIPRRHIQSTRDKAEHARRRRVWDHGFSVKALRDYEPRIAQDVGELMARFDEFAASSTKVDATKYFNFFAFDFMGGLAFGQGFEQLRNNKQGYFLEKFHEQAVGAGLFSHAAWLGPFILSIPGLSGPFQEFWNWVEKRVTTRMGMTPSTPDVFQWIKKDYEQNGDKFQIDLAGEASIIVMAGSDTVAAMLTYATMHLASDSRVLRKLQYEIDHCADETGLDATSIAKLPYLNAIISETLRLHPPVPSGVQRMTPPKGLWIKDVMIPGNTIVQVPMNTVHRGR